MAQVANVQLAAASFSNAHGRGHQHLEPMKPKHNAIIPKLLQQERKIGYCGAGEKAAMVGDPMVPLLLAFCLRCHGLVFVRDEAVFWQVRLLNDRFILSDCKTSRCELLGGLLGSTFLMGSGFLGLHR